MRAEANEARTDYRQFQINSLSEPLPAAPRLLFPHHLDRATNGIVMKGEERSYLGYLATATSSSFMWFGPEY